MAVATDEFQTIPDLLRSTQVIADAPLLYVPGKIAIIADHELGALEEMFPPEVTHLDRIT
jgi:hypothetical protein